eukprot:TRINITY_DN2253_c0_g1_i1.p1 TRINITY_DN2253_c0_g1~~TRINITY_DN2253_c0_g1_i1.p1  ORF type:complete len:1188 (-),score=257.47 TRINITY_DN2253_c0_g1_i1:138-3254(-)
MSVGANNGRVVSWSVLSDTVPAGATSLTLVDSVPTQFWKVGYQMVIASSDFNHNDLQHEVVTITQVSGKKITFTPALAYEHYGKIYKPHADHPEEIDMRTEVGLLNRNLVIRGDITQDTTEADQWGGHILSSGAFSELRVSGVELYHMGQKDNLARYPIHFHRMFDSPSSYAVGNGIHDTFQRAITIHGTNYLTIEDNVAFNVNGHVYFIEDANEHDNMLKHNLAILANSHTLLDPADLQPACFWVTQPRNHWVENHAVGCDFGYWFAMPLKPVGFGPGETGFAFEYPRYQSVLTFKGNVAHGHRRNGWHSDDMLVDGSGLTDSAGWQPLDYSYLSQEEQEELAADAFAADGSYNEDNSLEEKITSRSYRGDVLVEDFVGYKNKGFAVWGRGDNLHFVNCMLSDNKIGAQFPGRANLFEDSFMIAESDNVGSPSDKNRMQGRNRPSTNPDHWIVGYRSYDASGPDLIKNVKFFGFKPLKYLFTDIVRHAGALSVQGGSHVVAPRHKYVNMQFIDSPVHVWFEESTAIAHRGAVIKDTDGSITGDCGAEIAYHKSPILYTDDCTHFPAWHAYVCPSGHRTHHYLHIADITNSGLGTQIEPEYSDLALWRLEDKAVHLMQATGEYNYRDQQTVNGLSNTDYLVMWGPRGDTPTISTYRMYYGRRDEYVRFAIPYPSGTTFSFLESTNEHLREQVTSVSSLSELTYSTFFYDEETNLLWIELKQRSLRYQYYYDMNFYEASVSVKIVADCPDNNCRQMVDPMSITQSKPSQAPAYDTCDNGRGVQPGRFTYTPNGPSDVIFDESLNTEWRIRSNSDYSSIDTSIGYESSTSLLADLNSASLSIGRLNDAVIVDPKQYTHFEFKLRTAEGRGPLRTTLYIRFYDDEGVQIDRNVWDSVQASSPYYTADYPFDDTKWSTVRIDLKDTGLLTLDNLWSFNIYSSSEGRSTPVHFDDMKFVSYSVQESNVQISYSVAEPLHPGYSTPLEDLKELPAGIVVLNSNSDGSSETVPIVAFIIIGALIVVCTVGLVFFFMKSRSGGDSF